MEVMKTQFISFNSLQVFLICSSGCSFFLNSARFQFLIGISNIDFYLCKLVYHIRFNSLQVFLIYTSQAPNCSAICMFQFLIGISNINFQNARCAEDTKFQFLIGISNIISKKVLDGVLDKFQFLIGISNIERSTFSNLGMNFGFNSLQVFLICSCVFKFFSSVSVFQFLIGISNMKYAYDSSTRPPEFQFLIGISNMKEQIQLIFSSRDVSIPYRYF